MIQEDDVRKMKIGFQIYIDDLELDDRSVYCRHIEVDSGYTVWYSANRQNKFMTMDGEYTRIQLGREDHSIAFSPNNGFILDYLIFGI